MLKYISFWQQKHRHPPHMFSSLKNTCAAEQNTIILPIKRIYKLKGSKILINEWRPT